MLQKPLIYTDQSVCIMAENLPKKERQSQIMEAAMKVFTKKGFASARMDDIVKESGLSKGAIYYYYEGKKDIYIDEKDEIISKTLIKKAL